MNETIREYLKRRVRWCMALGFGGWLLFASSGFMGNRNPIVIFTGFAIFGGAILATQWVIKCPRCSARLGQVAMYIGAFWSTRKPMNFCPFCGVSLDEPRVKQTAPGQQTPFNPIS